MTEDIVIAGVVHRVELQPSPDGGLAVRLDGQPVDADLVAIAGHTVSLLIAGRSYTLSWELEERTPAGARYRLDGAAGALLAEVRDPRRWDAQRHAEPSGRARLTAPMAGKVVRVCASPGDPIAAGQGVIVLEAMKMQNEVRSPKSGTLAACPVTPGQTVATGQLLAEIE